MWSLAGEDSETYTHLGNMLASLGPSSEILASVCDERIDGAIELIACAMPVQTIVPAFIADQFLGELLGLVNWRARKILFLRLDQFAARIHGRKFILPMRRNTILVFPRVRVEIPRAVVVHQGNRKRPVFAPTQPA